MFKFRWGKKSLMEKLVNRPFIKVFPIDKKDDVEQICNAVLEGYAYLNENYPNVKLEGVNIWLSDPFQDRTWRFWLHTLIDVEVLVEGFEQTGRRRYLDKAVAILLNWAKYNYPKSESNMAWHDHTTALRLIIICRLFENWKKEAWDDTIYDILIKLVNAHTERLLDPTFYLDKHNHGLDQDISLYVAATVFDYVPEAKMWKETALQRFWKQMDHLFASDGSYREHSPAYTYVFIERLLHFAHFIRDRDKEHFQRLYDSIKHQIRYLTYVLQPDGHIPPLGDSISQPIKLEKLDQSPQKEFAALQYVATRGGTGEAPDELDAFFPEGGYAIFRNQWLFNAETMQVVFSSGFHSRVHKHHDDLSFTLFGHKQPLLIDAGQYKFDYDSLQRKFVVSTRAHNTVTVDGMDTVVSRLNIGKSGLTDFYSEEWLGFAAGAHCLYPGVIHRRLVIVLKPFEIIVVDWIKGFKEHIFEQHFNFAPHLTCQGDNLRVQGFKDGREMITLTPLINQEQMRLILVKGEKDPWRGWSSPNYGELTPVWTAGYIFKGKEGRLATRISVRPDYKQLVDFQWYNDNIQLAVKDSSGNMHRLDVIIGARHCYLAVNGKMASTLQKEQPTLWKAMDEAPQYEYRDKYRQERERRIQWQEKAKQLLDQSQDKS